MVGELPASLLPAREVRREVGGIVTEATEVHDSADAHLRGSQGEVARRHPVAVGEATLA